MEAWISDANNLKLDLEHQDELESYIVMTPLVEEFLKTGAVDHKLFIAAPKGLGKTLLLKAKSQRYRMRHPEFAYIPQNQLVEQLSTQQVSVPQRMLNVYSTEEAWNTLWKVCLHLAIVRRFDIGLPAELTKILGFANNLPDIMHILLSNYKALKIIETRYLAQVLSPIVRELREYANVTQVAMFIDNLDESFHTGILAQYHMQDISNEFAENVWLTAQVALIESARRIRAENGHIRIFASIRSEAFDQIRGAHLLQLQASSTVLRYSKQELRMIFEKNIALTSDRDLARPRSNDLMEKFFGFADKHHHRVMGNDGSPAREDPFEYVLRHTFGRPREIVYMGANIRTIRNTERNPGSVGKMVNNVAYELFQQYKREILPHFNEEAYKEFVLQVEKNVIPFAIAASCSEKVEQQTGFSDIFSYLWRLGLVGHVSLGVTGKLQQNFERVGKHASFGSAEKPNAADYYLVHPALDDDFKSVWGAGFYDASNIVGDGLSFNTPGERVTKKRHVHIGLGNLGLSLVIFEFAPSKSLAVIYDPDSEYTSGVANPAYITIETRRYPSVSFQIIGAAMGQSQTQDLVTKWRDGLEHIFVSMQNKLAVDSVLRAADTMSTVINESQIPWRQLIKDVSFTDRQEKPILYIGDRYWSSNALDRWSTRYNLPGVRSEPMLLDRHVWNHKRVFNQGELTLRIDSEDSGLIAYRYYDGSSLQPGDIVQRPKTNAILRHLNLRQKLFVEGTYRLYKTVMQDYGSLDAEQMRLIFEMFFSIQIQRLMVRLQRNSVFPGKSESAIQESLYEFCFRAYQRTENLVTEGQKTWPRRDPTRDVERWKRLAIFPKDEEFYAYVANSNLFYKSDVVITLKELIRVKNRDDLRTVFLSYSETDKDFVLNLAICLEKRGVGTNYYHRDAAGKKIRRFMRTTIEAVDRVIFIASRQSISSELCHEELSYARKKRTLEQVLIPIRLDTTIFEVSKDSFPLEYREEYWRNVETIRDVAFFNFPGYQGDYAQVDLERLVDDLVKKALRK